MTDFGSPHRRAGLAALAVAIAATIAGPAPAEMYKWLDKDGAVHFTDTPPPAGARPAALKPVHINQVGSGAAGQETGGRPSAGKAVSPASSAGREEAAFPKVEMYSTSWCPSCKKAKEHLRGRGVPFDEYDIEKDAAARQRQMAIEPSGAVPTTVIGTAVLVGFSADAFDNALRRRP